MASFHFFGFNIRICARNNEMNQTHFTRLIYSSTGYRHVVTNVGQSSNIGDFVCENKLFCPHILFSVFFSFIYER